MRQISVFLENKAGQLSELTEFLSKKQVNLRALSVADTQDFGIVRIIASDPDGCAALLQDAGYIYNIMDVLAVSVSDEPGALAKTLAVLAEKQISVEYIYAFLSSKPGYANLIFRVEDGARDAAIYALKQSGIQSVEGV